MEEKGKGKALMSQLLGAMKNQFNRGDGDSDKNSSATDSHDDSEAGRRSLRSQQNPKSGDEASDSPELKRSTRRSNQKGSGGSILQSAIARKEKSYSVSTPPSTSASSASKNAKLALAKKKPPVPVPAKTPPLSSPPSLLRKKVPKAAESVSSTTSEISTASLVKEEVLMESEDNESIISAKTEEEVAPLGKPDPVLPPSAEKKRRLVDGGPQDGELNHC
jgi:hypothetical protein